MQKIVDFVTHLEVVVGEQHAESDQAMADRKQANDVLQVEVAIIHMYPFLSLATW